MKIQKQFTENVGFVGKRPWGYYEILYQGENFQIKKINIIPNQRLSLQSHRHREEIWTIVKGEVEVEVDGKITILKSSGVIFIPKGSKHRVKCISNKMAVIVEIQKGEYLGEDDIKRYEDDYKRV